MSDDSAIARLTQGAIELGVHLSSSQIDQFSQYLSELQKWNRRMNLSGLRDPLEIVTRHFLDSLAGAAALRNVSEQDNVSDLGTGAGFPGVPLKIAIPSFRLTLVEPRQKRAAFLLHLCGTLKLTEVHVVEETIGPDRCPPAYRQRFNRVLMRAVADPVESVALAGPLVRPGGKIIIWSSDRQAAQVEECSERVRYRIPGTQITSHLLIFTG